MKMRSLLMTVVLVLLVAITPVQAQVELYFVNSSVVQHPDKAAMEEIIAEFERQNPDIKIVNVGNNPPWLKTVTLTAGGETPDITQLYPDDIVAAGELGILEDLGPYLEREGTAFVESISPGFLPAGQYFGQQLALPFFGMTYSVLYNMEHFADAGVEVPQTFDEMVSVSKKLTDGRKWGMTLVGSKAPKPSSSYGRLIPQIMAFGATLAEREGDKWVAGFNNAQGVEAFTFLTDLVRKHKVVPPGVTDTSYNDARVAFANGRTSMFFTSNNAIGQAISDNPDIAGKLGSFPYPNAKKYGSLASGTNVAILKDSEHKEEAWRFIKFLLLPENQEKFAKTTGRLPITVASKDADFLVSDPALEAYLDVLDYSVFYPPVPNLDEACTALLDAMQMAWLGRQTPEQAVAEAARKVEAIWNR